MSDNFQNCVHGWRGDTCAVCQPIQQPSELAAPTGSVSGDDIYKRCAEMMQACAKLLQEAGREMDDISDARHLHEFADKQENLRIQYEDWLDNVSLKNW